MQRCEGSVRPRRGLYVCPRTIPSTPSQPTEAHVEIDRWGRRAQTSRPLWSWTRIHAAVWPGKGARQAIRRRHLWPTGPWGCRWKSRV